MILLALTLGVLLSVLLYAGIEVYSPSWLLGGPVRRALLVPLLFPAILLVVTTAIISFPFLCFMTLFSKEPADAADEVVYQIGDILGQGWYWITDWVPAFVVTGEL